MSPNPLPPISDAELLTRIRRGDTDAFEILFRTYVSLLCGFAYRYLNSTTLAEEVVQDVFLAIWTKRAEWSPKGTIKSYLFVAVRNRAFQLLERHRTESEYKDTEAREYESSANVAADHELTEAERATAVQHAITSLPERARLVFTLHREQELTYAEIATVLDISIKTVESQMSRALRLLRERLSGWGRALKES